VMAASGLKLLRIVLQFSFVLFQEGQRVSFDEDRLLKNGMTVIAYYYSIGQISLIILSYILSSNIILTID
jgi:hypothetical protein